MSTSHPTTSSYTPAAKLFHWVLAAVILVQLVLAQFAKWADHDGNTLERLALLANHKSLGLTALVLIVARVGFRLTHKPPALPVHMSRSQRVASHVSHAGLYVLMLAMPISGLVMSLASAYGLSWFNLAELPKLMAPNENLSEAAKSAHEVLGYALVALVLVHFFAAIYHHVVVKDNVLKRMSSRLALGLFALLLGGLSLTLTPRPDSPSNSTVPTQEADPANVNSATFSRTEKPNQWPINYEPSFIRFTAEQAGAEFDGEWPQWEANITFNKAPLSVSIDVNIDVSAASTNDDERDATLMDSDWFHASKYPAARFFLDSAERKSDGSYTGTGLLTIKDKPTPVDFDFTIEEDDGVSVLLGVAKLDRLKLGVGTGEWIDTSWVGQFVEVEVRVVTSRKL